MVISHLTATRCTKLKLISNIKNSITVAKDIDFLFITEKSNHKIIQEIIRLYPFDIHPTIITSKDFIDMLKTNQFNVVNEAIKRNIILFGAEDYYRLLENVRRKKN